MNAFDREPEWDPRRYPPAIRGPRPWQTVRLAADPIGYMTAQRRALGPVFTLRMLPYRAGVVCACSPETNREVLTDAARFRGGDASILAAPIIGDGSLILTPPPKHMPNRKRLLPPFHGEQVARWADRVEELVERDPLPTGEAVAVRPWSQRLTLDVILRVVFGIEQPERVAEFRSVIGRFVHPLIVSLPLLPGRLTNVGGVLARRRAAVRALLHEEIAQRRRTGGGDDVLSLLLASEDMTDAELRDELMGLVLAGHETTATAIAWTLHLLAQHPEARSSLIDDLDAGGDTYLKATIKESLRLRSPVIDAIRIATEDTELGGHPVPKDAFVVGLFSLMHLDDELWPDARAFRPERHLTGDAPPYAWTPFGGGVRRCIGAALANLEVETVLRVILARAVPEPVGREERVRLHGPTLVPARGGRIRLRPRESVRPVAQPALRAAASP